jgi:hypothetical protein
MLPQSPFPQHDAAVDSGRPNGMEPVDIDTLQPHPHPYPIAKMPEPKHPVQAQPAQSGAPAKGPELKIAAPVKPSEPAKPIEPPKPKPAVPARPTPTLDEFDQSPQPLAADPKPEHNPLHMDIQ